MFTILLKDSYYNNGEDAAFFGRGLLTGNFSLSHGNAIEKMFSLTRVLVLAAAPRSLLGVGAWAGGIMVCIIPIWCLGLGAWLSHSQRQAMHDDDG